ncbi:hypothetical protein HPB49_011694 [Dermacentor silvarum]|uniref:Uncharacterized protein n=1 Tax=Dermacentor silvarum TaxID=543639 RepID=A0ACB8C923_DERSI|nr:hypothetical protein HPB49_011694 [Dermacentor silvarum]
MLRNLADAEKERRSSASKPSGTPVSSAELAGCSRDTNLEIPEAFHSPILTGRCPSPPPHARWWKGWHWHAYSGIAAQLQYFPEQQTGFRSQRCTADSISDVVANLEDAKAMVDVAMLVFLDVQSAFDGLPYAVIEACPDCLG